MCQDRWVHPWVHTWVGAVVDVWVYIDGYMGAVNLSEVKSNFTTVRGSHALMMYVTHMQKKNCYYPHTHSHTHLQPPPTTHMTTHSQTHPPSNTPTTPSTRIHQLMCTHNNPSPTKTRAPEPRVWSWYHGDVCKEITMSLCRLSIGYLV